MPQEEQHLTSGRGNNEYAARKFSRLGFTSHTPVLLGDRDTDILCTGGDLPGAGGSSWEVYLVSKLATPSLKGASARLGSMT